MVNHRIAQTSLALAIALAPIAATARPEAPLVLCERYPEAADCAGAMMACGTCHTATWPPAWNEFGAQISESLATIEGDFASSLGLALEQTAELDADADGSTNYEELVAGTRPDDPSDAPSECISTAAAQYESFTTGALASSYDYERALRRVSLVFCGVSPRYEELAELREQATSDAERYRAVHAALDRCLDSEYWRDEALRRVADPLVKPISTFGLDSAVGFTFSDYEWDYRLFAYVLTGDRDIRDLLRADYHVVRDDSGDFVRVEGIVEDTARNPIFGPIGGQHSEPQHRAGMITTDWFLLSNTLRTLIPRITAAQAYRAYLGYDIALEQGLYPVAGEPLDVDNKGVAEPMCAVCHSTLDPLAYAFAAYEGTPIVSPQSGVYAPRRLELAFPDGEPPSYVLGEPVGSVVEWAERASQSDAFLQNIASLLFFKVFDREPTREERPAFDASWRALEDGGWRASSLMHAWIDFPAFGG